MAAQEEESLIATHCDFLQQQAATTIWSNTGWLVKRNTPAQNTYARYLSAWCQAIRRSRRTTSSASGSAMRAGH